jgi:hypothetical protein
MSALEESMFKFPREKQKLFLLVVRGKADLQTIVGRFGL